MSRDEIEKLEQESQFSTVGELLEDLRKRIEEAGLDPNTPIACQKTKRGDVFGHVTYGLLAPFPDWENDPQRLEITAFDAEFIGKEGFTTFFTFMFF